MLRFSICLLTALALLAPSARAAGLHEYVGTMHGHSAYSDGYPGSTPASVLAHGRAHGEDFFAISDHSDTLGVPVSASQYCFPPAEADVAACALADTTRPADSFRKWDATLEQADAGTTPAFTGIRGFEWSSDRFGHVNVLFSANQVNAKADGGYADMRTFYGWLRRPTALGGGADAIAIFNHPGDKKLSTSDPAYDWDDFAYDPAVDEQLVGLEVFNSRSDFGSPRAHNSGEDGWYAHALDKGWHVGAIGAEDLGHDRGDDWGGPEEAKTVIAAPDRSRIALKAAMTARRTYAIRRPGYRLDFGVDDAPMGARLQRPTGRALRVRAAASAAGGTVGARRHLEVDLVTSGGRVVATAADGTLDVRRPATADERWYVVRVRETGDGTDAPVAYSSPVWVDAHSAPAGSQGEWLAGDLHVHTCFSRDVYCGPADEPLAYEPGEGARELQDDLTAADAQAAGTDLAGGIAADASQTVTYGLDVGSRFSEAAAKGLDYLAVTDHEDVRSSADPSFGSSGVLGLPAYENSLDGHAQMLGASRLYPKADVLRMDEALHADGGLLQANHPVYRVGVPFTVCGDPTQRHWKYGYDIPVDSVETWNPTNSIAGAEAYLECRLQRGEHVAATGGSDSHWASLTAAGAGVGSPTTWLFSSDRSPEGLLQAVRAGRTSVSKETPAQGGDALLLEADPDHDGVYDAFQGDTVPAGTPMRLRSAKGTLTGVARIRANGQALTPADPALVPGGTVDFVAPAQPGWVRADLLAVPVAPGEQAPCPAPGQSVSTCTYDQLVLAMTSPVYLEARDAGAGGASPQSTTDGGGGGGEADAGDGVPGGAAAQTANGPVASSGSGGPPAPAGAALSRPFQPFRAALRIPRGQGAVRVRRRGLVVQIGCNLPCRTTISVVASSGRRVGVRRTTLVRPGRRDIAVRLAGPVPRSAVVRTTASTLATPASRERHAVPLPNGSHWRGGGPGAVARTWLR